MAKKVYSKDIILEIAFELSKEIGVNALSMRMLAKELGCSVMPIYDAFESKENLINSLSNYCIQETIDELHSDSIFDRYQKMIEYGFKYPKFFLEFTLISRYNEVDRTLVDLLYNLMRKDCRLKDQPEKILHRYNFEIEMFIIGCVYFNQNERFDQTITDRYKKVVVEMADSLFSSSDY